MTAINFWGFRDFVLQARPKKAFLPHLFPQETLNGYTFPRKPSAVAVFYEIYGIFAK
jgi:hypothetical protein